MTVKKASIKYIRNVNSPILIPEFTKLLDTRLMLTTPKVKIPSMNNNANSSTGFKTSSPFP